MMLYIFPVLYGYIEQRLLKGECCTSGKKWIFGHFATYHVVMLSTFVNVIYLAGEEFYHLPLLLLMEDISFYLFRKDWPNKKSWVSWGLGGFKIFSLFIPTTYILLVIVFLVWRYLINVLY
ncbi:MAG: hypothetical protein D8M58_19930 [Calditrichaeota bacterium]|nr:MAG: hypothetical protein DWQ03_14675 [Calditrichota bacterium]MBL1207680.1 hypothetical protein [Calditrichota bacterium]NOG47514.1 hypothetical protein [Calditrichota bacterium]